MNTKWLPKTLSADIKRLRHVNWLEIIGLIALGLVIAIVQANLHLPLKLPGWRGLIWLTPLVATRLLTPRFGAASIISLSATGFSLLFGVSNNPFDWLFYLVVGELLDLAYHLGGRWRHKIWFWTMVASLVHLTKPLARIMIGASSVWSYNSMAVGSPMYMIITHLFFGAIALSTITPSCI
jgi:hypothetical protein